jgi:addiction module HigA family antidote
MPMKNPVHPGRILREDCLKPLGLTVKAAADVLDVSRPQAHCRVADIEAVIPAFS